MRGVRADGPKERYPNSTYAEQGITAGEQQKITEIRLEKLNVEIKADGGASDDASSRRVNALGRGGCPAENFRATQPFTRLCLSHPLYIERESVLVFAHKRECKRAACVYSLSNGTRSAGGEMLLKQTSSEGCGFQLWMGAA